MNHLRLQWRQAASKVDQWWGEPKPGPRDDEDVTEEWHWAYDGEYGVVKMNDEYGMWGKVWPIYEGPGMSTYFAHVGIQYYENLQTILNLEHLMRSYGMTPPPRRKLLDVRGIEV